MQILERNQTKSTADSCVARFLKGFRKFGRRRGRNIRPVCSEQGDGCPEELSAKGHFTRGEALQYSLDLQLLQVHQRLHPGFWWDDKTSRC